MEERDPYKWQRGEFQGRSYECSSIVDYLQDKDDVETSEGGTLTATISGRYYFTKETGAARGVLRSIIVGESMEIAILPNLILKNLMYGGVFLNEGAIEIEDPVMLYTPAKNAPEATGSLMAFKRPGGKGYTSPTSPVLTDRVREST